MVVTYRGRIQFLSLSKVPMETAERAVNLDLR